MIRWHTQAVNIMTGLKVKIYLILPAINAANIVMWICHLGDSAKSRYYMILGLDLLTELLLN